MSDKVKEQFEKEFYEEEFELLVLTSEECKGAIMLDNKYINPSVDFVASIDCKTGKLIKSEGRLTWLIKDENCDETANSAMATLLKYAKDKQGFDQKNREFAAKELLDLANDWLEDNEDEDKPDKITKEMFIDNIKMSELCISPDGSITLFYDDGDMFWGHTIQIIIDENGNYDSADIAG